MRRFLIALAVLVPAAPLPALSEDKPAADANLFGTWEVIETRHPLPAEPIPGNGATWEFTKEGKFRTRTKDGKIGVDGTYKTAPAAPGKNFREMDIFPGPKIKPWKVIYQVDGDNLALVIANLQDSGRPDDIMAKNSGSKMTFKRQKP